MASNPPINRIDFSTGQAVVYADNFKYTFPIKGLPPGTPATVLVIDNTDAITKMSAKLDLVLAAMQSVLANPLASTPTPLPGTATPPPGLNFATIILTSGGTTTLEEGVYIGDQNIAIDQTFLGKGMRKTVLDGQRGVGAGHRLSFGKGIMHIMANVLVRGIGFTNGGGGDGNSDGEAGVWVGDTNATIFATFIFCAFDSSENGVFTPHLGDITLLFQKCVWGAVGNNGDDDGRSHDVYLGAKLITFEDSIFAGRSKGNTIKIRGPSLNLLRCFVGRGLDGTSGRWIDCPGGTTIKSKDNVFVTHVGCSGQNAFGLYDENDAASVVGDGSWESINDTFYFSRGHEVIWINNPRSVVTFTNPKVFWVGAPGSAPPFVEIQGPGGITGPNPFVFSESNRVDATPPVPADPVA